MKTLKILQMIILLVFIAFGENSFARSLEEIRSDYSQLQRNKTKLKEKAEYLYRNISNNQESKYYLSKLEEINESITEVNQKASALEGEFKNEKNRIRMEARKIREYKADQERLSAKKVIHVKKYKKHQAKKRNHTVKTNVPVIQSYVNPASSNSVNTTNNPVPEPVVYHKKTINEHLSILFEKIKYFFLQVLKVIAALVGIFIVIYLMFFNDDDVPAKKEEVYTKTIVVETPKRVENKTIYGDLYDGRVPKNLV